MSLAEQINLPEVAPSIPRRGNRLSRFIGRFSMAASGWSYEGNFPDEPKFIIAVVPHTSNIDFPVGLNVLLSMGLRLEFMGKKSLFWEPQGTILRWLGGVSIDRDAAGGTVGSAIEQFNQRDKFVLVITPEGTRGKVDTWKTGFYRIADGAGIPIVPAGFDYSTKTIKIGPPLLPSGDMEADFAKLREFYADIVARYPDKAQGIRP
jgi:1-acyl-sn-glycerol-3-phosphate acyltransferase